MINIVAWMLAPTEVTAKALGGQLMDFAVVTVEVQYAIGDEDQIQILSIGS